MKGNVSFVGFESQITHYWKLAMLLEIHVPQILCEGKITKVLTTQVCMRTG